MVDTRNVLDEFKNRTHDEIISVLDQRSVGLEIAIENLQRDYNMGTIVRSANAFGVRTVHVVGRRQWNKRGAMMTDKYLSVIYHATVEDFVSLMKKAGREIIAIENNVQSQPLAEAKLSEHCVLVFGSEGNGLSETMLARADKTVHIEQLGSTRSVNVGVAAGIAMYEWLRRHRLEKQP